MTHDSIAGIGSAPDPAAVVADTGRIRLRTVGPFDTRAMAEALSTVLVDGDLLVLTGDLGAGKTCFAQGLGIGLGVEDRITSPTFTLANRYEGRLLLHHLDVYRLDSLAETLDLGLAELLEDGVTVIEWGDRIDEVLPLDHLVVALRYPEPSTDGSGQADPGRTDHGPADHSEQDWDEAQLNERVIEIGPAAGGPSRWHDRGLERALDHWRDGR